MCLCRDSFNSDLPASPSSSDPLFLSRDFRPPVPRLSYNITMITSNIKDIV